MAGQGRKPHRVTRWLSSCCPPVIQFLHHQYFQGGPHSALAGGCPPVHRRISTIGWRARVLSGRVASRLQEFAPCRHQKKNLPRRKRRYSPQGPQLQPLAPVISARSSPFGGLHTVWWETTLMT